MRSYQLVGFCKKPACWVMLFISAAILLASCGKHASPSGKMTQPPWPTAYAEALTDALNPEPEEIVNTLISITRDTPGLQWKKINGVDHVLMVSLTGNTTHYEKKLGAFYNTGNYDTWVTASPEIKQICSSLNLNGDHLKMRLRELLGLVPDSKVRAFVEFWVTPGDLFRPSADNEIQDTTAGLTFPKDTPAWYRKWFNELRAKQYFQCAAPCHDAYPWTQLGYTYDWGNPESEQGLSEFVIKKNSRVVIRAIYPVGGYCR